MSNRYVPVIHGAALDRPDEQDTIDAAESIARSLTDLGFASEVVAIGADVAALDAVVERAPYVVFNLVEALDGEAARAQYAVDRLESLGVRYTGARAPAYLASNGKLSSKARFVDHAIPTPAHWLAGQPVPQGETVIVKSIDEHGSLGIDSDSVVAGEDAQAEIARRQARFGGRFFAEAFVDGREFNVSVIEARNGLVVLPIAEIDFDELPEAALHIVDFAAKWDPAAVSYHATPRRFGLDTAEPDLAAEIRRLSLASWHALGLAGYARVDFRASREGRVFVLEANANPCLAPDAGFAAAAAEAGLSYDDIIAAIVDTTAHSWKASDL